MTTRRLTLSRPVVKRDFADGSQCRVVLSRHDAEAMVPLLVALSYEILDEVELGSGPESEPPLVRLTWDSAARGSGRIRSKGKGWTIALSQNELELWLQFLVLSVLGIPSTDHLDLIEEASGKDLHFTLATVDQVEAMDAAEVRRRLLES